MLHDNRKNRRNAHHPYYHGGVFLFLLYLSATSSCHGLSTTSAESDSMGLLKTQDGYIIDDSIQASEQELRLEDFFWTGSGDGPPHYPRRPNLANESQHHGRDTILKTSTVVATVYVDQNKDTEPIHCVYDCDEEDESGEISSDFFPEDRRYWLLTILGGHYQTTDFPLIEHKLASLYRIAFSRQQLRHLSVENQTQSTPSMDTTTTVIASHQISPTKFSEYNNLPQSTNPQTAPIQPPNTSKQSHEPLFVGHQLSKRNTVPVIKNSSSTNIQPTPTTQITTTSMPATFYSSEKSSFSAAEDIINRSAGLAQPFRAAAPSTHSDDNGSAKISVLVHNITLLSDDRQSTGIQLPNGSEQLSNRNHSHHAMDNQTEIVYSVFVDGKPVLALTAAHDMQLVTEDEVSRVMDKIVYTKAEPFLRDGPLATPLVPPGDPAANDNPNQHANVIGAILADPVWIAIASILIVMVIVLFIGLVLMTRSKRVRSAQLKRLTANRALIEESVANGVDPESSGAKVGNKHFDGGGNDNLAFEQDGGTKQDTHHSKSTLTKPDRPVIHFPHPPAGSPTSSSTSDSSIYYPKRRSRLDIQNIIDERTINIFSKKPTKHASEHEDALYATIEKRKDGKHRQKRKYTTINRVGSLEKDIHFGELSSNSSGDSLGANSKRTHYYDPVDAINLNAVMPRDHRQSTYQGEDHGLAESPTETYNREVLKKLYHANQSPGSGSIGSYLSMASVRSFPKCSMPEPLNRVLEPLSVMHLDQSDGGLDSVRRPRNVRVVDKEDDGREPKAPFVRSQSDGADPGVIGPVVWEIHKRQMNEAEILSPIRDPAKTRSRFEGLLEGAINLYSGDISNEVMDEINSTSDAVTRVTRKDVRLKTAIPTRKTSIFNRSNNDFATRPVTAGPSNHIVDQPPSPYRRAWGSGAPSPLIRPLSAGPFHRPEPPQVDVIRVLAPQQQSNGTILSTAPLIEAIQNELKKFDRPKPSGP